MRCDAGDGDHLVMYIGVVVIKREANIRDIMYRKEDRRSEFLVKIPSNLHWIDLTYVGNRDRFKNHPCSPNEIFKEVSVEGVHVIVTTGRKPITEGSEILIGYGWNTLSTVDEEGAVQACVCVEHSCRGTI